MKLQYFLLCFLALNYFAKAKEFDWIAIKQKVDAIENSLKEGVDDIVKLSKEDGKEDVTNAIQEHLQQELKNENEILGTVLEKITQKTLTLDEWKEVVKKLELIRVDGHPEFIKILEKLSKTTQDNIKARIEKLRNDIVKLEEEVTTLLSQK